jgi:hypothetical protein
LILSQIDSSSQTSSARVYLGKPQKIAFHRIVIGL